MLVLIPSFEKTFLSCVWGRFTTIHDVKVLLSMHVHETVDKPPHEMCRGELNLFPDIDFSWQFHYSSINRERVLPRALLDYQRFQVSLSIKPDCGTFWCVLEACKMSSNVKVASETHGKIIKSGIELDNYLGSSLFAVYMAGNCLWEAHQLFENISELSSNIVCASLLIMGYSRSGKFKLSKGIFKKMPSKDEVSWSSIIGGSVKNNRPKEALSLFNHMLNSGIQPNGFTYGSVLSACAKVGALSCGEQVHIMIIEQGVDLNFILAAALIDMYSKCGQIKTAIDIFNVVGRDNVSVWNSMIMGLAIHGLGFNALELFGLMDKENVRPDSITFVGILSACAG